MSVQHQDLAQGRWAQFSLLEQMTHIGSEVERALHWRFKKNIPYSMSAFERALELIDLTLKHNQVSTHLREIARLREALADYFLGTNEFQSTENSWRKYFSHFTSAVRRNF